VIRIENYPQTHLTSVWILHSSGIHSEIKTVLQFILDKDEYVTEISVHLAKPLSLSFLQLLYTVSK
jgi:hypothetical protein